MSAGPVTVYTTPSCPWCTRAKDYLRANGVPFREVNVLADQRAAEEMVRISGQHGVPVITIGTDVILGFDQPRLEQLARRVAQQPKLGLRARDVSGGGIEVGGSRPGSPAEAAGFRPGDRLESIDGHALDTLAALERLLPTLRRGVALEVRVVRDGAPIGLTLTL